MSTVSLVKSKQSYKGTLKVLKPLKEDLQNSLKNLDKIVVKINFVTTKNELATTPIDTVRGFIDFVKPCFKGQIIIAEEASLGNTKRGFGKFGFYKLAKKYPQVTVFDSGEDKVEKINIDFPRGKLTLPISKVFYDASFIVSITRAKTHDMVVVTLGIKNLLVGAIHGGLNQRMTIHRGKDINWILAKIAKILYPNLIIIDGVLGMQGNGPGDGFPKKAGWLVSSFDALAADSLATFLMGFDIKDVGYLNLIHKFGLGKLYPRDNIEIINENPKDLMTPFQPHETFEYQRQWR